MENPQACSGVRGGTGSQSVSSRGDTIWEDGRTGSFHQLTLLPFAPLPTPFHIHTRRLRPPRPPNPLPHMQAKDALAVMEGRLSGTLLGVLSTPSLPLSVEGHVARLIEEATDHENLGKMYIWWMPWM